MTAHVLNNCSNTFITNLKNFDFSNYRLLLLDQGQCYLVSSSLATYLCTVRFFVTTMLVLVLDQRRKIQFFVVTGPPSAGSTLLRTAYFLPLTNLIPLFVFSIFGYTTKLQLPGDKIAVDTNFDVN